VHERRHSPATERLEHLASACARESGGSLKGLRKSRAVAGAPRERQKADRTFRFVGIVPRMTASAASAGARSDARRNRERIVAAARDLFASHGVDVPTREVASRAGVGVGTLYRHFPARDDLVDAVLEEEFEELIALAESALAEDDAWRGFTRFVEEALQRHACNRGLKDVVETHVHGRQRATAMRSRIRELAARLVARAQEDGALRRDFTPQDIAPIFWACDRVSELAGEVAPDVWRRHLGFVLDGLRSERPTPLAQAPLTQAQLVRVGRRKRAAA
jgi:AcrR family transcriptional regulator